MSRPFAGYVRVSRVGERDERLRSPEFQTAAIMAKATAAAVTVEMCKPELDVSGSKKNRAVLDTIVERIEADELAGVIVYNLSRLSRLAPRERIELVERIERAGGVILSASESFDATTPEGRFQREIFFGIARMQWEQYAEGFAVAKANAIANGIAVKNVPPLGYRFGAGHGLELVDEEAEVVRELFRMRAAGASYGECLARLELETGRSSYRSSVRYLLANRVYIGELRYGRAVELVNVGGAPAIVDEELFAAVQAINGRRARASGATGGKAKSLLAGIARCEGCGRGLVRTRTGSNRTYSYKCPADTRHCPARAHVQAEPLEAFVIEAVLAWAGPVADELVEVELEPAGDRLVAEQALETAEARLLEWAADLELEELEPEAYRTGLEARRRRVELRREELAELGEATELEVARGTVRTAFGEDGLDVDAQRELLAAVLDSVVVRKAPRGTAIADRVSVTFA